MKTFNWPFITFWVCYLGFLAWLFVSIWRVL